MTRLIILLIAISAGVHFLLKLTRLGYETAPYAVILSDGPFTLRDYPALTLVSTRMNEPDPQSGSSFMNLFRYITGANEAGEKIAMTTPVITMREGDQWTMSFVLPNEVAASGAPDATNKQVRLETLRGGRFAVYRSPASWSRENMAQVESKLVGWIQRQGLQQLEEPRIANYDPPSTPAFFQRNEMLVRVAN